MASLLPVHCDEAFQVLFWACHHMLLSKVIMRTVGQAKVDMRVLVRAGSHKASNPSFIDCYRNDDVVTDTYFQVGGCSCLVEQYKAKVVERASPAVPAAISLGRAARPVLTVTALSPPFLRPRTDL
jgi:hypothetical protein